MNTSFLTLLFFPEWGNNYPSDFLILHFFIIGIVIPFVLINRKARAFDRKNPNALENGYKEFNKKRYFGYEEIN